MKKLLVISALVATATSFAGDSTLAPRKSDQMAVRYAERRAELPADAADDRLVDIAYPKTPAPAAGYPCLFWIHGGSFSHGSRSMGPLKKQFLEKGYAVVALEYYLYRKHNPAPKTSRQKPALHPSRPYPVAVRKGVDAAAEDAELALAWIATNSVALKLDPKRVVIGGGSAGAITSLEVAYVRRKPTGVTIIGCLDFCGAVEDVKKIEGKVPPLMIVHGDKDMVVGTDNGRALSKRMDELNVKCLPIFVPDTGHSVHKPAVATRLADMMKFVEEL